MELVWYDINYKQPPNNLSGKLYYVTCYCQYWDKPQTYDMRWVECLHKGCKQYMWMLDGMKCPSTWEVTHWMDRPEPAKRD